MQYLCLGSRDKTFIEIVGISECQECKDDYQRNVNLLSLNLSEADFYKIKVMSEENIMNKELVIIQANSFAEARNIMRKNNYRKIPHYSDSGAIKKIDKFIQLKTEEKKTMIPPKDH